MDEFDNLANAVIMQTVIDYRSAHKRLKKYLRKMETSKTLSRMQECALYMKIKAARKTIRECERFFVSSWFNMLTALDGEVLLKKLKEDVQNER